jgi:hypothetical protein
MSRSKFCLALSLALFVLAATSSVEAQWVMAAHAARNRIQQMTQKSDTGGYAVAVVILDAPPAKVYDKTLKSLETHPEITISKHDAKKGKIEIRKGQQVGGFQISALGDNLTQLVFASSVDASGSNANSTVVDGILRVCKEVDVKCTVEAD